MRVDDLPSLRAPDFGGVDDPARPILSFAWESPGPHRAAAHSHRRAHIIQPWRGAFWVVTPEGTWLVPSGQALWVPPAIHHEVYSHGPVAARMLFVDAAHAGDLPRQSGTVTPSPLLTALIVRALGYGNEYAAEGPAARLARVLLDELAAMERAPLLLPISKDPRLARAMARLLADPASDAGPGELAREAGASPRTLARLFRSETGMTFSQWRTRLRLVASIDRLARGASVTEVAADLGYASASAFTYMFRTNMGVAPGRYHLAGDGDEGAAAEESPS